MSASSVSAATIAEVTEGARKSVVLIAVTLEDQATGENAESFGTGFVVNRSGYVLTAAHLFKSKKVNASSTDSAQPIRQDAIKAIKVRLFIGAVPQNVDGWFISADEGLDLALIRLRNVELEPLPLCSGSEPAAGAELYALGFPKDSLSPLRATFAHANADHGMWQMEAPFTFGMSGGPVLNTDGRVVAVIKGGADDADAIRWAVPVAHAAKLFEMAAVPQLKSCDAPLEVEHPISLMPLYPDNTKPLDGYPIPVALAEGGHPIFERGARSDLIFHCPKRHPRSYIIQALQVESRSIDVGPGDLAFNVEDLKARGRLRFDYLTVVLKKDGPVKAFWVTNDGKTVVVPNEPDGRPRANLIDAEEPMTFELDCSKDEKWPVQAAVSLAEVGAVAVRFSARLVGGNQSWSAVSDWIVVRTSRL